MGLHSHVQLVIEIYGQNQRSLLPPEKKAIKAEDLTLHADPTHPSYFPFSEPKFLEIAGLAGNPFCPRGQRRQHPLMWTADFTTQATLYAVRYLLLGDNKTQRAQRWDPKSLGPGGQQWKQVNDHLSQSGGFLKRLSDALNRAGHGMDAIFKDSPLSSIKSLQEMLNDELLFGVLFNTERHREPMFRQPVLDFARHLVPRLVKLWKRVCDDDRTVIMKLDKIIPQKRRRAQPDEDDDLAPKHHKQTGIQAQESDSDGEPIIRNGIASRLLLQPKGAAGSSRDAPKRARTANLNARALEANESMELPPPPGRLRPIPPPRPRRR